MTVVHEMIRHLMEPLWLHQYEDQERGSFLIKGGDGWQNSHTDRHVSIRTLSLFAQVQGTRTLELVEMGTHVLHKHHMSAGDVLVFNGPVVHRGTPASKDSIVLFVSVDPWESPVPVDDQRQGYSVMYTNREEEHMHVELEGSPEFLTYLPDCASYNELTHLLTRAFASKAHF